jgi:hypothetical protein
MELVTSGYWERVDGGYRIRDCDLIRVAMEHAETLRHRAAIRQQARAHAEQEEVLRRCEGLVKLVSFRGRKGITTLLPRLAADRAGLVSITIDTRWAYMQFWRSVFERRAPQSIAPVQTALGAELRQGNASHSFPDPLLEAITRAYREAAGGTERQIDAFGPHHGSPHG